MTTNFPNQLDTFQEPSGEQRLNTGPITHSMQHRNLNDAVRALEEKVGVNGSLVSTSLDYKLTQAINGLASAQDAITAFTNAFTAALNNKGGAYVNGVYKPNAKPITLAATVSGGVATFYLTGNGTAGGAAVFPTNVYKTLSNFWIDDANKTIQTGNFNVSADRKTITVTVNQSAATGVIALLGINLLSAPVAANGVVINATFWGGLMNHEDFDENDCEYDCVQSSYDGNHGDLLALTDYWLRAANKAEMDSILTEAGLMVDGQYVTDSQNHALKIIGVLYDRVGDGENVTFVAKPGYHANLRLPHGNLPAPLMSLIIDPATPENAWL